MAHKVCRLVERNGVEIGALLLAREDVVPHRLWFGQIPVKQNIMTERLHIVPHEHAISAQDREQLNGHRGHVLWFTGLSGSGKSTLASAVEKNCIDWESGRSSLTGTMSGWD